MPGPLSESALVGVWSAPVSPHPEGEDWTPALMTITASEAGLQGLITPKVGRARALVIRSCDGGQVSIDIPDMYTYNGPGSVPCFSLGFLLTTATYREGRAVALDGDVSGRCPSTILNQKVRFTRP